MFNQLVFDDKDPSDQTTYSVDFSPDLGVGETITSCTVTASIVGSNIPTTLTIGTPGIIGNIVGSYITGGFAGTQYKITYSIFTSFDNVVTRSVLLFCQLR
jgi:hypothetical protein